MTPRPLRICIVCGTPTTGTRCTLHTIDRGYTTSTWQTLRRLALIRDGYLCQLQHPGCTTTATTVHLRPQLNGNHHHATLDDCTSACTHCHGIEDAPRSNGYDATSDNYRGGRVGSRTPPTPLTTPLWRATNVRFVRSAGAE